MSHIEDEDNGELLLMRGEVDVDEETGVGSGVALGPVPVRKLLHLDDSDVERFREKVKEYGLERKDMENVYTPRSVDKLFGETPVEETPVEEAAPKKKMSKKAAQKTEKVKRVAIKPPVPVQAKKAPKKSEKAKKAPKKSKKTLKARSPSVSPSDRIAEYLMERGR